MVGGKFLNLFKPNPDRKPLFPNLANGKPLFPRIEKKHYNQTFDSNEEKSQEQLFISGVCMYSKDSENTIVGYYISPYGKKTSEYIYKPIVEMLSVNGDSESQTTSNIPTSETKFSPGYFLSNIVRSHNLDKESGIEEETIKFITKNYEKNIEEVTLKVQTMMTPGSGYTVKSLPDPTQCGDDQYIKKIGQTYTTMSDTPRTFSHECQDTPISPWKSQITEYKNPIGGLILFLIFFTIIYFVYRGISLNVAMKRNNNIQQGQQQLQQEQQWQQFQQQLQQQLQQQQFQQQQQQFQQQQQQQQFQQQGN
jgi:hypothetical protein